jgi:hypothetical protein
VGFHWGLRIHRVRVDVPGAERLGWDLLWLGLFTGLPLAAAWLVGRGGPGRGPLAPAALASWWPPPEGCRFRAPPDATARPVLFRADMSAADILAAVAAADGRIVSAAPGGRLVVVDLPSGDQGWSLYRSGALAVGGPGSPLACLSWTRI